MPVDKRFSRTHRTDILTESEMSSCVRKGATAAGFDRGESGCHFAPELQNAIMAYRQMPTIPIVTPIILLSLFSARSTNV